MSSTDKKEIDFTLQDDLADAVEATFIRQERALLGPFAYYGDGNKYYADFMELHNDRSHNEEADLIKDNVTSIKKTLEDTETGIIIGPGPAASFDAKEIKILKKLPKLKTIVLIDVSEEYLQEAQKCIGNMLASLKDAKDKIQTITINDRFERVAYDVAQGMDRGIPKNQIATVFATGGTFGNIENPSLDAFPTYQITQRQLQFAALAGLGGHTCITYFSSKHTQDSVDEYYNRQPLRRFFQNVAKTISEQCPQLADFSPDTDMYDYKPKWNDSANIVEHRLIFTRPQKSILGKGDDQHIINLNANDTVLAMASARIDARRLADMPEENIAMRSNKFWGGRNSIVHIFDVVREPRLKTTGEFGTNGNGTHQHQSSQPSEKENVEAVRASTNKKVAYFRTKHDQRKQYLSAGPNVKSA